MTNNHYVILLSLQIIISWGDFLKQNERQAEILDLVQHDKASNVKELCSLVYASPATIRRDLHDLEKRGQVRLLYGNIVPVSTEPQILPLAYRENQSKIIKRALAQYAASIIPENVSIMLDSSSSAMYMADYLSPESGLTIFTNCFKTALRLIEKGLTVYFIGGRVDNRNYVTSGSWADENVKSINVDYLFFSSRSVSSDGIISGSSELGVQIRGIMIEHSKKQFFLCSSDKVNSVSTFSLCNLNELTGVITDSDFSDLPNVNSLHVNIV